MKWLSAIALCLVVVSVFGQAYDDWIKSVDRPINLSVSFNCTEAISDDEGHPRPEGDSRPWENATVQYWLAHTEKVEIGDSIRGGNIFVSPDGWMLTVRNVTREFHGIYHCVMLTDTDDIFMVKWGINMKGPYFVDLWDKYEMNVIIGFSAMAGFLVMAAIVLGVYHFRWIDPVQEKDNTSEVKVAHINQGYLNGAYTEPKDDFTTGYNKYDEVKLEPEDEYNMAEPVVVSVAEVHSDSTSPVYVDSTYRNSAVSSMPEPEADTKF